MISSHGGGGRQVDDQRLDLGPQEVVRAGRAEFGQRGELLPGQEVQHDIAVGEVPDLRPVRRGDPADRSVPARRPWLAARSRVGPRSRARPCRTAPRIPLSARNFSAVRMISSEFASACSLVSPQAVMPCPPRMQPMACGFAVLIAAMSSPNWNPGRRHGTHTTRSPKPLRVSSSPSTAVARAIPESGCR